MIVGLVYCTYKTEKKTEKKTEEREISEEKWEAREEWQSKGGLYNITEHNMHKITHTTTGMDKILDANTLNGTISLFALCIF